MFHTRLLSAIFATLVHGSTVFAVTSLPTLSTIPNFTLTNQNNTPTTQDNLKGKIWVADFIYSQCGDECPMMTSKMAAVQSKVKNVQGVAFVTVTTDPVNDTPKVLKSYAAAHKADEANWFFLTGDKKEIVNLSKVGFKLPADLKRRIHTEKFALVDKEGHVRGYYDSTAAADLTKLEADIHSLADAK